MTTTKRQVFYSFHYKGDSWRTSMVRNIGAIEGNKPATDNDWETVVGGGEEEIKKWIKVQMKNRSCTIVLIGEQTAGRPWITYEISESWNAGMGVVGIYIHGLKDQNQYIANKGNNPFDYVDFTDGRGKLSSVVKCYNPGGNNSQERYAWIAKWISPAVEEAIKIRNNN